MEQLSALDSAFLYLETRKAPMHIGALHIFSAPDKKNASFEEFYKRVEQRLHLVPVLRQRIVQVPFELDAPYLVDDPDFSLSMHLSHIGLPQPGTRDALNELTAKIQQRPIDRQSALWELVFIDNMIDIDVSGRAVFAVVSKIHHSLVDGKGGEEFLSKLLDFSPEPHQRVTQKPFKPKPLPSALDLFFKSYGAALFSPVKMAHMAAKVSGAGANLMARNTIGSIQKITSRRRRAPASLFERQLSDDRVFAHTTIELAQLKRCRTLCPTATIHDVILGIIAKGLASYLKEMDAVPKDDLVALVPFSSSTSTRTANDKIRNELLAVLVTLNTKANSVVECIELVQKSTEFGNQQKPAKISQLTAFLPNLYLSIAAKLYTRWHISSAHSPMFNIVITNVPGPQIPMYMGKARLVEQYGNAPIFNGMGLSIVVLSYNGSLSISLNSCSSILPEPNKLADHIQESFQQLWLKSKPKAVPRPKRSRRKQTRTLTNESTATDKSS